MNPQAISRNITRVLLYGIFLTVTSFSVYLADDVTWKVLLFALFKGILAVIFSWLFLLILSDAIVKSIISSVADSQHRRKEGGLLYHFIKPADNEGIRSAS